MNWLLILAGMTAPASFDCARAVSPAERTICADPALARADVAMAAAYARALAALSPAGRRALRDEQRTFIAFSRRECRPGGLAFIGNGTGKNYGYCLLHAFQDRTQALGEAVTVAGGRQFLTLHRSRSKHVDCPDCTNFPAIRSEEVALAQIDTPRNAGERAWNATVRRRVAAWPKQERFDFAGDTDAGDVSVEAKVVTASADVISLTIGVSSYGAGAAHPNYESETFVWSFRLGGSLAAVDLFADPRAPALRRLVYSHYDAGGSAGAHGCDMPDVARSKFTVDRSGIDFQFDPYELGGYTCGGESKVTWGQLQPFLKRSLPFDPRRLEAPRKVVGTMSAR